MTKKKRPKQNSNNVDFSSTCIPMERSKTYVYYSFTFNPVDQPDEDDNTTLSLYVDAIKKLLESLKYCNIILYPEMSSKGRWHYHGYLMIINIPAFYYEDLLYLRSIGHYEIDTISDYNWALYVSKNENRMTKFCSDRLADYCINITQVYQDEETTIKKNELLLASQLKRL